MAKVALLLNSGGLDTLLTAKILKNQGWELHSLFIDLGQQPNEITLEYAENIANKYCETHDVLKFTANNLDTFNNWHSKDGKPLFFGLPYQASVMLILGSAYAVRKEIGYVATGQKVDIVHDTYFSAFNNLLCQSKALDPIIILSPIKNLIPIEEVVKRGLEEGLTMEEMKETYSCNQYPTCNICKRCLERKESGLSEE